MYIAVIIIIEILKGFVFIAGQAELNPEYYFIKYVGRW